MKWGLSNQHACAKSVHRRRFWSAEEKRRMVAESLMPGASAAKVAQRYGVNANLLFTWRRQETRCAADGGEPLQLLPVTVADAGAPAAPVAAPGLAGRMEIVLGGGERILVGADVDAAALARVIEALRR
jgi:transposase-like protein